MQQDSNPKQPLLKLKFVRQNPWLTFAKPARKIDAHFASILKVICHPGIFLLSAYLEFCTHKIAGYRLGNKTLFPFLCCKVIKGLFVLTLRGSFKKESFHFSYNRSCALRNYTYPWNNPMRNLLISDTYFPQKPSHSEREMAFHKRN